MDGNKSIQANFIKRKYQLNISIEGEGTVDELITSKTSEYEVGTKIELRANPALTWKFKNWSGNISGSENPYTITLNNNFNITAKFEEAYIYIPDNNFEQALIDLGYDDVLDDLISIETAESITSLQIAEKNITSLEGIEGFKNLTFLGLYNNQIGQLDISSLTELTELDLTANNVSQIDVSQNLNLEILRLNGNQITEVNVSKNENLRELYLFGLGIESLDLSNNHSLTNLDISYTNLDFIDLSSCPQITYLLSFVNNPLCIKVDQNRFENIPGPCTNENPTTCFDTPNWNFNENVSITVSDNCDDISIDNFGFEQSEVEGFKIKVYNEFKI